MRPGATAFRCDDDNLEAIARFGVTHVVVNAQIADPGRLYATVDELKQQREIVERNTLAIEVMTLPILASSHIDREADRDYAGPESPARPRHRSGSDDDQELRRGGDSGLKYNMSLLGVLRTGRRGARGPFVRYFKLADAKADPPLTSAGGVTADMYWERITYFLERVIPVADEYKVRMACHPNDSMTPPEGYQGVNAVLSTVDGLKRFVTIKESPYHGFNFCQGTVAEMLQDPGKEIYDVIRYFGTRRKIFKVHFRNIRGNRQAFMEVAPTRASSTWCGR